MTKRVGTGRRPSDRQFAAAASDLQRWEGGPLPGRYPPVPVARLEQRKGSAAGRWYHVLAIPCARGATHIHRVRLDQNEEDTKRKFNAAEYLRQIPPGTATFDRIYGDRPDSESINPALDATWWNKRTIAYGAQRQTLAVLGFAQTQHAIARHRYLKRQAGQAAIAA